MDTLMDVSRIPISLIIVLGVLVSIGLGAACLLNLYISMSEVVPRLNRRCLTLPLPATGKGSSKASPRCASLGNSLRLTRKTLNVMASGLSARRLLGEGVGSPPKGEYPNPAITLLRTTKIMSIPPLMPFNLFLLSLSVLIFVLPTMGQCVTQDALKL